MSYYLASRVDIDRDPRRGRNVPLFGTTHMDADAWYERGCDAEASSLEGAVQAYEHALTLDPDHAGAHVNLGRLLHRLGNVRAAERHYRQALRTRPDEPVYWYNLGVALQDQRLYAEAAVAYRVAIALDPGCRDSHFNLAGVLERLGDVSGALRHLAAYRRLRRASPPS